MIEVREFQGKKLVEYLRPGLRVRLLFAHGPGDTVLFLPVYNALKALYPDVYRALKTYNGQEELFDDGDFADATVRGCQPRISALTGLLQQCGAFIGCNSGPYRLASAIGIPTLFVHTIYPSHSYIRGSADIIKKEDVTAEKIRDRVIKAYSNGRTI